MHSRAKHTRVELGENQKRNISTSLHLLDKELCQWEQWIDSPPKHGAMYQQQDTLSTRQKHELHRRIDQLRREILRVRDDLKLEPARPVTSSLIVGGANVLWEMLCELNSTSLQGYGEVSADLAQYLNPIGKELAQKMYEIARLFS
jgi:hypothetical protein